MSVWAVISIILFIAVIVLFYLLNKKTREKEILEKQESRGWALKTALEKSFNLPAVEANELETVEPQIDKIMNEKITDEEAEEKMRLAIMSLYANKQKRGGKKE